MSHNLTDYERYFRIIKKIKRNDREFLVDFLITEGKNQSLALQVTQKKKFAEMKKENYEMKECLKIFYEWFGDAISGDKIAAIEKYIKRS